MSIEERLGLGPLVALPLHFCNATLTTPVKVTLANATAILPNRFIRLTITNGSPSATIAWSLVAHGAAAPTITADYNATTGACHIPPGGSQTFSIPADKDLYVVASASAPVNVTSFLYQQ